MEKIENGTTPLTDEEAESVTGGESQLVQTWRRMATDEGRPVQIGSKGSIDGPVGILYKGWIAGKCPSCGVGEALFASSHTSRPVGIKGQVIRYENCKCYICKATWSELFIFTTAFSGYVDTKNPRI
jgi:hypothetical protein